MRASISLPNHIVKRQTYTFITGKLHELLMSFSLIKNGEAILNTDVSKDRVGAIEGIRSLTMMWIILIHVFLYGSNVSGKQFADHNK